MKIKRIAKQNDNSFDVVLENLTRINIGVDEVAKTICVDVYPLYWLNAK